MTPQCKEDPRERQGNGHSRSQMCHFYHPLQMTNSKCISKWHGENLVSTKCKATGVKNQREDSRQPITLAKVPFKHMRRKVNLLVDILAEDGEKINVFFSNQIVELV